MRTIPKDCTTASVVIVNDTYKKQSIKPSTSDKRGEECTRVHITSATQNMLQGREWNEFFNNIYNKQDLISQTTKFFLKNESMRDIPLFINDGDSTYKITGNNSTLLYLCNQEETDTKMIYHASLEDAVTVFVATDTDVLILLCYSYAILKPNSMWFMKIGHKKFVDIETIVQYYDVKSLFQLPHIRVLSGCDSTSYMHGVGKVKLLRTLLKDSSSLPLLSSLGRVIN